MTGALTTLTRVGAAARYSAPQWALTPSDPIKMLFVSPN